MADVTLEVLDTKLDNLDEKLNGVGRKVDGINGMVRTHETAIARLQERQTVGAFLQGAFTVVASAVAGALGMRQ